MNERKKGAILSYIQVFLSVVVSMIYVPVLLHFLGQSEYGLYQIVGSFFSYVTVFESCVSAGILRNYCNALGRSDHEEAAVTLSMARSIYRFLAIILDLVGVSVVFAFRSFYAGSFSTSELNESIAILILLFVNMTFTLQGSVYLTVLTGHEKYTFLRILSILMQVIQPLLVILCVSRIPYAITVSVVIVLLNLLTIGIRYGYVTQKTKNTDHKTAQRFPDREKYPWAFCCHPAWKHCGSDLLENRSGHSGTNVQHRSRCRLFCRRSNLHDVHAVRHTGLRCFLSKTQRLVSRRKRSAESIGFVHPDRTDHLLHHPSGFIRLHRFRA